MEENESKEEVVKKEEQQAEIETSENTDLSFYCFAGWSDRLRVNCQKGGGDELSGAECQL